MSRWKLFATGATAIAGVLTIGTPGALAGLFDWPKPAPNPNASKVTKSGLYETRFAPADLPPTKIAAFAAGCFWGVEQEFRKTKGVIATAVGYMGGHTPNPTYKEVCTDTTGHAETVQVEYDPKIISYDQLLEIFWDLHDPTTPDQQGPDFGSQYRSVVFFYSPEQKTAALASRDKLKKSGELAAPIVTEIIPGTTFTKAEDYHQQYVEKGGRAACHIRKKFPKEAK